MLGSSFVYVLPFLSMSGLIGKMGVRKLWISTPGTHPRQSPMLRDCFILAGGRKRVSLYFKLGVLLFAGTHFATPGSATQCISPIPKMEYVKPQKAFIKRILFIRSLLYGVESKEKQAMENKRKLTSRTLHVRDKKPISARELSSHWSYIRP